MNSVYNKPSFLVQATKRSSKVRTVSTGIRQACPSSPDLCLVVHSAITHGVATAITNNHGIPSLWGHSRQQQHFDLAYADDTEIFAKFKDKPEHIQQPEHHST